MILYFSGLDAFIRGDSSKAIFLLRHLDDYGVLYKSFSEQYLDSSGIFKDVIISILSTLAKQEQIRLSERVRAGLEKAKFKGRIGGRPRISQENIDRINILGQQGLSNRRIGTLVKIHHRTVVQYLQNIVP